VVSRRDPRNPPLGALTRAFFEMYPNSEDNDLLARTIVGIMMGALPTINGNLVTIVKTWMKTSTRMVLQAKLNSSSEKDEFVRAHEVIEQPMQETMQMTPTPDALWRLAVKEQPSEPRIPCRSTPATRSISRREGDAGRPPCRHYRCPSVIRRQSKPVAAPDPCMPGV
jgi:hypothetical protein